MWNIRVTYRTEFDISFMSISLAVRMATHAFAHASFVLYIRR